MVPYVNITEAQTYFDERLDTESWDDASSANKLKALKQATRLINRLNFVGNKANPSQENEFPRGVDIIIPNDIKYATCELALRLLDGVDINLEVENLNATSRGYGTPKTNYDRSFVLSHIRAGIPSTEAWEYLLPYLADPLSVHLIRK